jgi:hypothetical protein
MQPLADLRMKMKYTSPGLWASVRILHLAQFTVTQLWPGLELYIQCLTQSFFFFLVVLGFELRASGVTRQVLYT